MKTRLLPADAPGAVEEAATALANGELVAFPTDTVYGLAAGHDHLRKLYVAKDRRETYAVYAPEHDHNDTAKLRRLGELRGAIARRELVLHYQPKVDVRSGEVVRVEALVRWHHPERGLVPPGEFIPLAEQTGLIAGIGEFVLDTSLAQAAEWRSIRHDGGSLTVWVNLSARQLGRQYVASTAPQGGIGARRSA